MTTTDMAFMGIVGVDELAAGALALNATWLVMFLGFGIIAACGPLIAQALGSGDERGVRRSARQGFWVAATLTPFVILGLWFIPDALLMAGQPPHLVETGQRFRSHPEFRYAGVARHWCPLGSVRRP